MRFIKGFFVSCIGLLSFFYLLNPGGGFVEFLPDNIPLIGNIDEASAAVILLACLRYFGLDIGGFINRKRSPAPSKGQPPTRD